MTLLAIISILVLGGVDSPEAQHARFSNSSPVEGLQEAALAHKSDREECTDSEFRSDDVLICSFPDMSTDSSPDSRRVVIEDGQTFIEIRVNHSGLVQLGCPASARTAPADAGVFAGLALLLLLASARRAYALRAR